MAPEQLKQVPVSQQPMRGNNQKDIHAYTEWASDISSGVLQIINGPRGHTMSADAKTDLCTCLNLMRGSEQLPFAWDISLYVNPPPLPAHKESRSTVTARLPVAEDSEDDYDLGDLDSVVRPQWSIGEVHIVKVSTPPFWIMGRLFCVVTACLTG